MTVIIHDLAQQLGNLRNQNGFVISTAESCTGGWVAEAITSVSGSSEWFDRGFVTYSNQSKQEMLGVRAETLEKFGAVSEETAREMAEGALTHSQAQISIAITGIAGPDGGTKEKPVGTIWFAWSNSDITRTKKKTFTGNRHEIRLQAVITALNGLLEMSS